MTTNRCQHFSQKLDSLCYRIDVWRSARVVHRHEVLCHESVSRTHSGHETHLEASLTRDNVRLERTGR